MRLTSLFFFTFLITFTSFAQPMNSKNNYSAQWKSVDNAFQKGLDATAEKAILNILKSAKKENNSEQIIKAICNYRVSLRNRDEKSRLNDILFLEAELPNANTPVKQVLHSMLGDLYWQYYVENRWKILDRTQIAKPNATEKMLDTDIETWSANDFYEKAYQHFNASLKESSALMKLSVKDLYETIEPGKNTEKLRPTIYDFITHRAIEYFQQGEIELTKPTYSFEINDDKALASYTTFIDSKFKTSDTTSRKYQVLKLYQAMLSFHKNDADPAALIDADILRIRYVNEHIISDNKNELYIKALENIINKFPENEQTAMAMYYLAETYTQGGRNKGMRGYANSSISEDNIDYIEAKRLYQLILKKFPSSQGASLAEGMLQQIETHTISIQYERTVLPNKPSLALINFRNINTAYCKIVKLSNKDLMQQNYDYNENAKQILSKSTFKSWVVNLPEKNDHKGHSTEIKIEALPLGTYAIIISESPEFSQGNITAFSYFHVSNLAYLSVDKNYSSGADLYVVHRETGEPLENVVVKTWRNKYDYNSRKHNWQELKSYTTDKDGYVKFTANSNDGGFIFELIKGDDQLVLNDNAYVNDQNPQYNDADRTFFFTDRSIYRPGQTIYFKGICVRSDGKDHSKHQLLTQHKTKVMLMDVNYQLVKEQEFATNEFGSFSGSFIAPEGLLTGSFHIQNESGNVQFNVEEYKRPKFEVTFDTLKETYKLNDSIHVKAIAKAFAGNSIDGANVKYRVIREARFPYYWCFYRWGQPASAGMEISHGFTQTSKDGSFDIAFKAIPDLSIDKKTMPVFDYKIYADVTDINGETRSATLDVSVSYQALVLNIDIPQVANFNDFNAVKVTSTNLAGTHSSTDVQLSFKKLVSPTATYRKRLWPKAEINSIPEKEFRKDFPLDEYNNENDYLQWKEEKTLWNKSITTSKSGVEYLQKIANDDGWYLLEAKAKDKDGQEVIDKKYIRLSTYSNPIALPCDHLLLTDITENLEPGKTAKIALSTPYENVHLLYDINRNNTKRQWITFMKTKIFEYPLTESDRGGFQINAIYVKNNRFYHIAKFVNVPWTNKELLIGLETFRDKMLPGSEQQWKLKITGSKKEQISAEILATLYDASLDAFKPHVFTPFSLFQNRHDHTRFNPMSSFMVEQGMQVYSRPHKPVSYYEKSYARLNWWGLLENHHFYPYGETRGGRVVKSLSKANAREESDGIMSDAASEMPAMAAPAVGQANEKEDLSAKLPMTSTDDMKKEETPFATSDIQLRSNFSETAFFFPQLQTDQDGAIILSFTAPEALTRWKLLAFAHTTSLQSGMLSNFSTTQKELMIVPNTPRFLREGDKMVYSAKVTNMTDKAMQGQAMLQLVDALTEQNIDAAFTNQKNTIPFSCAKGESALVTWNIEIPLGFTNPVMIKTFAKANDISDGEQNVVPVLLNSMLVTETLPLPVRSNSNKSFSFKNLLNSKSSSTLRHHSLTLEYTGNPAWYAVQSLPYLTDYPYECAEQTFNRYYANALASHIANSSPKIKEIFSNWSNQDTAALLSNLQKNEELKSAMLQETPWVLEAKSEAAQKREIASLFNINRMSKELERTVRELQLLQTPNGGFTWFKGMPDNPFITQYIVTGIGKLLHLGVNEFGNQNRILLILEKALPYVDARMRETYQDLVKHKVDLNNYKPGYMEIQYLYMRSFFLNNEVAPEAKTAFEYFKKQSKKYWVENNRYMQGMLALALNRYDDKNTANAIVKSLRENAIRNEEMGMYWKEVGSSYWWYEAPIETQSLLVEVFKEVAMSEDEVDELKIWLLKNKQTTHWKTTKATADACYALLLNGTYWLSSEAEVNINLGDKKINSAAMQKEAGTGYFKTSFLASEISANMGNIHVAVSNKKGEKGSAVNSTTWGAVYWQYFENLDKINPAETPLSLKKQLYIERNTDKGLSITPITNNQTLQVGDKLKVRIELRVDRPMEYVHMKDMRGACFEPSNVLSQYKYQGGLGYYEATKDAATNFFFDYLQKGTYVFEYRMFVTHEGNYSNGVATIQCMYAPEFSSHSEGIRVEVR